MEKEVFKGKFFRVTIEELGLGLHYERVYQRDGVTILPITEDEKIKLIRLATTANPLERIRTVNGYVEDNETPLDCAKRELAQELELSAERWTPFITVSSGTDNGLVKTQHVFVAKDLRPLEGTVYKDPHEITSPIDFTYEEVKEKILAQEFGVNEATFALLKFILEARG